MTVEQGELPMLYPTLPGMVEGIIAVRPGAGERGRDEHDIQCQRCGAIETTSFLIQMRTKFYGCWRRRGNRTRICQGCHTEVHFQLPGLDDCE